MTDAYTPNVYDVKLETEGNTHTLEVDTNRAYGWFENSHSGSGGGLWFEKSATEATETEPSKTVLTLTDYDGTACLPMRVIRALRAAGFIIPEEFE